MRGIVTAVWFVGVMAVGAVAGVELAYYRQGQLIKEAQNRAQPAAQEPAAVAEPTPTRPPPMPKVSAPRPAAVTERSPAQVSVKASPKAVETPQPPKQRLASALPPRPAPSPVPLPTPQPQPALPPAAVPPEQAAEEPSPAPVEAPKSHVRIVISLPEQRAYVFKDGELWDSSRVSTGKKGKRTPVGTFTILEKAVWHRSNKYSNAPMPYMQRITWGGVALHAGYVPGYPASHGCIRLPRSFAKKLYKITNFSSTVVVTDKRIASAEEARTAS
jgi:lipoprotein-anchoring transpeptidase ErfK/SrfK